MDKAELVEAIMSREMLDKLYEEKLGKDPVGGVIIGQRQMTRANILSAKAMLALADLETVKKTVSQVIYDFNYMLGKKRAEELGNPTDLDSYVSEYVVNVMDSIPPVPPIEILERTKDRCLWGCTRCQYKDGIEFWRAAYPDYVDDAVFEVLKSRCTHDHGWTIGFNPNIQYERVKFLLDGDDGCFFDCRLP
jgi:hypothetical protein